MGKYDVVVKYIRMNAKYFMQHALNAFITSLRYDNLSFAFRDGAMSAIKSYEVSTVISSWSFVVATKFVLLLLLRGKNETSDIEDLGSVLEICVTKHYIFPMRKTRYFKAFALCT
jgi:hypothetical protein